MKRSGTLLTALLVAFAIYRILPIIGHHSGQERAHRAPTPFEPALLDPSVQEKGAVANLERPLPPNTQPDLISTKDPAPGTAFNEQKQDSLDTASPTRIRTRLLEALEKARKHRGFSMDERIIGALTDQSSVPIIVGGRTELPDFQDRLFGTRYEQGHRYRHIPYAALEAGPQAVLELIETHGVDRIELDERHHPTLAESVPLIFPTQENGNEFDGTGYAVVVIDTGVDTDHPIFRNRITDEACFSRQGDCPGGGEREFGPGTGIPCSFGCSHGTLVAGIALGMDEEGTNHGVARDAGLIAIQVFSEDNGEPAAWTSDILAALEHVYDLSLFHEIAAVSMSLGGGTYSDQTVCDQTNSSRKAMIDQLRSIGIPTIVSSGNDGEETGISSPACISSVISVGSTTKDDAIPSYSNSADYLSILAPGHRIRIQTASGGYRTASGTSMATPHVSGAIAVIREAVPDSSLEEILFALQYTGIPIIDSRNDLTFPRIDVTGAIEFLAGQTSQEDDDLSDQEEETNPEVSSVGPSGDSDSCGLIGLEILFPLLLTSRLSSLRPRKAASQTV